MKTRIRFLCGWMAAICLLIATVPFTVAAEDEAAQISWAQMPPKRTYYYGERPNVLGGVLRITFADGTYEDAVIQGTIFRPAITVSRLGGTYSLQNLSQSAMHEPTVSFTVLGHTVSDTVTVAPMPTQWELAVDGNHALSLTVDGEHMAVRAFDVSTGSYSSDGAYDMVGTLYTDRAVYLASVCKTAEGALTVSLGHEYYDIGVVAVSNPVRDDLFFLAVDHADKALYSLSAYRGCVDRYDGTVPAEDTDALFRFAVWHYSVYPKLVGSQLDYHDIDAAYARQLMKTSYGVDFDPTQSGYYVPEEGTLHVPKTSDGRVPHWRAVAPVYRDGLWRVEIYSDDGQAFVFSMNDEWTLTAFEVCASGDVTGDRIRSTADARTLLLEVIGTPSLSRSATMAGDRNRDGAITSADVRQILLDVINA